MSWTFLLSTYIYDTLSRRTSLVYGNGAAQGYTYSTQGDLLTLASTLSATSNTYTNTFTPAHQLMSEAASNAAWAYVPAAFQTTNYAAANNLNQYVNITVGANPTVTLGYDANGNLTGDGVWTFAYDAQNMLRSAVSAASTSTYQYDPLGRRQMLTEGGTTTTFLHDGDEEIADYAAATVLRRYVPGPGTDMPIAMVTPSGGSNTRKYFHTNRQGSTIAMSADDGTLSEGPYTYDAYGNGAPATGVPFKYTGRRLDAGTGLYYYRARYYSAALGRFLQVDPVGYEDQMNLYAYVKGDPLNLSDPTGQKSCPPKDPCPDIPLPSREVRQRAADAIKPTSNSPSNENGANVYQEHQTGATRMEVGPESRSNPNGAGTPSGGEFAHRLRWAPSREKPIMISHTHRKSDRDIRDAGRSGETRSNNAPSPKDQAAMHDCSCAVQIVGKDVTGTMYRENGQDRFRVDSGDRSKIPSLRSQEIIIDPE